MRPNALVGFTAVFLGVAYGTMASGLRGHPSGNQSVSLFPLGLGFLMTALGLLQVVLEARKGRPSPEGTPPAALPAPSLKPVLATAGLCLFYVFALESLGFLLSTAVFLGGLLFLVNGARAWKTNTALTLLFSLGAWFLSTRVFHLYLP